MDITLNTDDVGVATITLNRPDKLNAFTREMLKDWENALVSCQENDAVRVIVLTGAGRAFCAGGDASDMKKRAHDTALDRKDYLFRHVHRIGLFMEQMDKPVIASVNGAARGAGMDLALMCDIRIAAASATMAESYVGLGLTAGGGGAWYLPRLTRLDHALEIIWTARAITAEECLQLGLVTRVVPDDQLQATTYELAHRIARQPQNAVRFSKRAVYQGLNMTLISHFDMVSSHIAVLRDTDEYRAKIAELIAKKGTKP